LEGEAIRMARDIPPSWPDQFEQQTQQLTAHFTNLQVQMGHTIPPAGVLQAAMAGYSSAVEELRVTEDELRRQSEELTRSYAEIEAERQRYQDLFESALDPYFVTDPDGRVRAANRATGRLLKHARKYILAKPLAVLIDPADQQRFRTRLAEFGRLTGDWLRSDEVRLRPGRTATPLIAQYHVAPLRDSLGTLTGLRWLFRDVTAQRATEARLQALTASLERQVRERTAELESVTKVTSAALHHEQASHAATETALAALQTRVAEVAAQAAGVLGPLAAQDAAVAEFLAVLQRLGAASARGQDRSP
jgi:PAS domain S-box-containing protein